jgi:hypothetical protein
VSDPYDAAAGGFDPERLLRTLDDHGVVYVLVGGVAARLHGSPTLTEDVDVTPERSPENLGRLATALAALDARLAVEGVAEGIDVPLDERTFTTRVMAFSTVAGEIDVVLEPAGVGGYEHLGARAVRFRVLGFDLEVAALDDIITSKEVADRPKDRAHLQTLRQLRAEIEGRA